MKKYFELRNKSFDELGVKTYKELWEKVKADGYEALRTEMETVFTKAKDKENTYHFIFSTADEDRHGEIVEQNWDLKNFKKNPVVLDSHNYDSIFNILGKVVKIGVKDNKLQGDIQFNLHTFEGYTAEKMVADSFVSATSVGFIPLEFDDKGKIVKSELLEQSLVSVPANAKALREEKNNQKQDEQNPNNDEGASADGQGNPANGDDSQAGGQENNDATQPDAGSENGSEDKAISREDKKTESTIVKLAKKIKLDEDRKKEIFAKVDKAMAESAPVKLSEKKRKFFKSLRNQLSKDIS